VHGKDHMTRKPGALCTDLLVSGSGVMSGTKILRFRTIKNLILLDSSMAQLVS